MTDLEGRPTPTMAEINLLKFYPRSSRPIDERGRLVRREHRQVASRFSRDYFDGDRLFGYGGYHYHPRFWQQTVAHLRDFYKLDDRAALLDVGCAKAFMLFDFSQLLPQASLTGVDISSYALRLAHPAARPLLVQAAADDLPFPDNSFDLVISINTIHNLDLKRCKRALSEIQRVTRKDAFVTVDAWRTDQERESLLKWNLTAQTYMHVDDWKRVFSEAGYRGDYFWFLAE